MSRKILSWNPTSSCFSLFYKNYKTPDLADSFWQMNHRILKILRSTNINLNFISQILGKNSKKKTKTPKISWEKHYLINIIYLAFIYLVSVTHKFILSLTSIIAPTNSVFVANTNMICIKKINQFSLFQSSNLHYVWCLLIRFHVRQHDTSTAFFSTFPLLKKKHLLEGCKKYFNIVFPLNNFLFF